MTIYKFTRLTLPPTLEKRRDVLEAFRTLVDQDDELVRQRRAEIAAIRREAEDIRRCIDAILRQALELRAEMVKELKAQKYSPDQPRVPAGNPRGGEWTREGFEEAVASPPSAGSSGGAHPQLNFLPVAENSKTPINDPRIVSDVTPDNTWVPGAQYAAGWEHHWVPWGSFGQYKLRPETRKVFIDAKSGLLEDTTVNRWSREHRIYNDAVDEAFQAFLKRNNIPLEETERLTPAQAEEFLGEVLRSTDPRIRNFNRRIWYQSFRYWMRHGAGRKSGGDE